MASRVHQHEADHLRFHPRIIARCTVAAMSVCIATLALGQATSRSSVDDAIASLRNIDEEKAVGAERDRMRKQVERAWKTIGHAGADGEKKVKAELDRVIRDRIPDNFFRLNAARLLWISSGVKEADTIAAAMRDAKLYTQYHYVFHTAFEAGKTQDARAIPILKSVLHDDQGAYFVEVHQMNLTWPGNLQFIWGVFGSKGLPALHDVLKSSKDRVELKSAAVLLGQAQYLPALSDLRGLAKTGTGDAQSFAIEWLAEFGHPDDYEFLVRGLSDHDEERLKAHLRAVKGFEDLRAVPAVASLLGASSDEVRELAIYALSCLVNRESLLALHDHAERTKIKSEKAACERTVNAVLSSMELDWAGFMKLSPAEQTARIRAGDTREAAYQLGSDDKRITRAQFIVTARKWIRDHRLKLDEAKGMTPASILAVATPDDLDLLIDVRAAVYSRLSDECVSEVETLDDIIRRLSRTRYRKEIGVCEKVELRTSSATSRGSDEKK